MDLELITKVNYIMIGDALELDKIVYDEKYVYDYSVCKRIFDMNENMYIMVYDKSNGVLAGYVNYTSLNKKTYDIIKEGLSIDTVITENDVVSYKDRNIFYHLYFSSIVTNPKYRRSGVANMIIQAFISEVDKLSNNGIFFDEIVADCISEGGVYLTEKLNMQFYKMSLEGTKIMLLELVKNGRLNIDEYRNEIQKIKNNYNKG